MILLTALRAIFKVYGKQKLEVVDYASSHNFCVAAKHYQISRSTIRSWSRQVEALRSQAGYRCRLAGRGRKPIMDSNMETELENWIIGYRHKGKAFPGTILQRCGGNVRSNMVW